MLGINKKTVAFTGILVLAAVVLSMTRAQSSELAGEQFIGKELYQALPYRD
jgi:hypothetical protein